MPPPQEPDPKYIYPFFWETNSVADDSSDDGSGSRLKLFCHHSASCNHRPLLFSDLLVSVISFAFEEKKKAQRKISSTVLWRQEEAIYTDIWLSKRLIYFSWDRKCKHKATGNNYLPFRAILASSSLPLKLLKHTHKYNFAVYNQTGNNMMSNVPWTLNSQKRRLEFYLPIYVWTSKINYLGFFWTKTRYSYTLFDF